MQLHIQTYDSGDLQLGKMSRETYESIPHQKRPQLYPDGFFLLGDLIRPTITIQIVEDSSLFQKYSLYLH